MDSDLIVDFYKLMRYLRIKTQTRDEKIGHMIFWYLLEFIDIPMGIFTRSWISTDYLSIGYLKTKFKPCIYLTLDSLDCYIDKFVKTGCHHHVQYYYGFEEIVDYSGITTINEANALFQNASNLNILYHFLQTTSFTPRKVYEFIKRNTVRGVFFPHLRWKI